MPPKRKYDAKQIEYFKSDHFQERRLAKKQRQEEEDAYDNDEECKYYKHGCREEVADGEKARHESACKHMTTFCAVAACNKSRFGMVNFPKHLKEKHARTLKEFDGPKVSLNLPVATGGTMNYITWQNFHFFDVKKSVREADRMYRWTVVLAPPNVAKNFEVKYSIDGGRLTFTGDVLSMALDPNTIPTTKIVFSCDMAMLRLMANAADTTSLSYTLELRKKEDADRYDDTNDNEDDGTDDDDEGPFLLSSGFSTEKT